MGKNGFRLFLKGGDTMHRGKGMKFVGDSRVTDPANRSRRKLQKTIPSIQVKQKLSGQTSY